MLPTPEIAQFTLGDLAIKYLELHCTLLLSVGQDVVGPSWKNLASYSRKSLISIVNRE